MANEISDKALRLYGRDAIRKLRSLVTDIEAMRQGGHSFGDFDWNNGSIEWPNLSILCSEADALLRRIDRS